MYKVGKGEWAHSSDRKHQMDINVGHYVHPPQCQINSKQNKCFVTLKLLKG